MKSVIFKDKELQRQFNLNGYVVVPFLSASQVAELQLLYQSGAENTTAGFYSTSFNTNEQQRQQISNGIEKVFVQPVNEFFTDVKSLGACFLVKQPGPQGEMPIHQDWTVVKEPDFDSITIWVPLQDVTEYNGAIQVIPGSHRFSNALRSPSLPDPFKNVQSEMRNDLQLLPMKAGEAFIFSHALLHASPANQSNNARVAATFGLIDAHAQLMFYHQQNEGELEQYFVDRDFFQKYNTQIGERPQHGTLKTTLHYSQKFVSPEEYGSMKRNFEKRTAMSNYKMIPIFKEEQMQKFFEKEGYAKMPLLNESEVRDLKEYYQSLHIKDEKGFGFHVSMDQSDKEMCRKTREKVWGVVVPKLSEHLKDFKPFVASYVVKEVNPKGVVPAHQDWSFAANEEDGYSSITCWVALVDTNLDNGCMGVIRGSHKFMQNHRPSPSPQCPVPLSNHMFSIFPYLHTIEMKAGELLMFDNRTFHASPPNTSEGIRLAVGVGVTQKDAQLVHYYMKPDGTFKTMLRYNVDEDFFLKYDNATLARMYNEGKLIEGYGEPVEIPYSFTDYTSDELIELIKAEGNEYNIPMTEKLAKLFGYSGAEQKSSESTTQPPIENKNETDVAIARQATWIDNRTFFEKYTPLNIAREIKKRLAGA